MYDWMLLREAVISLPLILVSASQGNMAITAVIFQLLGMSHVHEPLALQHM